MALQTQALRVPVGTTSRLEFQLNNRNNQPALFMNDTPQALVLVVQNTGTQELSLLSRGKQPASIELRFRPGSLALKDPVTLLPPETAAGSAGWTLTQRTEEDATLTLALQGPAAGGTLKPSQSLRFVLDKILADTRGGTRAIRAQLRWWLSTPGGSAIEGSRQHHLSVSYLDQGTVESRFISHLEQYKKDQDALDLKLKQQASGPVDSQKLLADVTALQKLVTDLQAQVSDLKKLPAGSENPLPLRHFVDGDAAVMVSGATGTKSVTQLNIRLKNIEPKEGGRLIKTSRDARITFDFGKGQPWGLYGNGDSPKFAVAGWTTDTHSEADGKLVWNLAGAEIAPQNALTLSISNLSSTLPPGTAHVLATYEGLELDGKAYRATISIPIERRNDYHANPTQTIINGDVHVRNNGKLIFNKSAYAPDNKDPNQADIALDSDQLVLKAPAGVRLESAAGDVTLANNEICIRQKDGHKLKLTKDRVEADSLVVQGNVGIGTMSPSARLHVHCPGDPAVGSIPGGTWVAKIENAVDKMNENGLLVTNRWGGIESIAFQVGTFWDGHKNQYMPALTVTGQRKVGIGVNNPKIQLAIGDNDTGLQQEGDGELAVFTNNVERLRVNKNGKVGIGVKDPMIQLAIGDNDTGLQQMGDGELAVFTNNVERLRVDKYGNVALNGSIKRKDHPLSVAGEQGDANEIPAPAGTTTDDWNIFVCPKEMGMDEPGSNTDNALLLTECYAKVKPDKSGWIVVAKCLFRRGRNEQGSWKTPRCSYLLVAK